MSNTPKFISDKNINNRLIVSIYDYSGNWPSPYIAAGYPTILWDYKVEGCILQGFTRLMMKIDEAIEDGMVPWGLLAAPPCTDLSVAGAWTWPAKDVTPAPEPYTPWSVTDYSVALVEIVRVLKDQYAWTWWALENPPGRLEALCEGMADLRQMLFQPWHYGDPHTKKTVLWGKFNRDLPRNEVEPEHELNEKGLPQKLDLPRNEVEPELVEIKYPKGTYKASSVWAKTGGRSEKTKTLRSNTPAGFSKAFFRANP